jgi:hypothetical protein
MRLLAINGKGCPREYTHTHMGVHENILRKGKKRSVAPPVVYPKRWRKRMTQDAAYLNEK